MSYKNVLGVRIPRNGPKEKDRFAWTWKLLQSEGCEVLYVVVVKRGSCLSQQKNYTQRSKTTEHIARIK